MLHTSVRANRRHARSLHTRGRRARAGETIQASRRRNPLGDRVGGCRRRNHHHSTPRRARHGACRGGLCEFTFRSERRSRMIESLAWHEGRLGEFLGRRAISSANGQWTEPRHSARSRRRYARMVRVCDGWSGHLWQGRFASFVLVEPQLTCASTSPHVLGSTANW
jgi:hypothetical protein